jgi:hypothetical protein
VRAAAVKLTTACALPAIAETEVGAPGVVVGVTAVDAIEEAPVPALFVAVTIKVYAVPLVSPVTVSGEKLPLTVKPLGAEVTVKLLIVAPPVLTGAVKFTTACALPATAETMVGAPGVVVGVTAVDPIDAAPAPALFVAVTVNVYAVPLVSPVTVMGEVLPVAVTVEPPPTGVAVIV